jgi:hypothetical protein
MIANTTGLRIGDPLVFGRHPSDFEKSLIAQTPLGRVGQVGDIAPIAVFLASGESAGLSGEVILATGGIGAIEGKFDDWARSIHS